MSGEGFLRSGDAWALRFNCRGNVSFGEWRMAVELAQNISGCVDQFEFSQGKAC